jgi:thiol:disulfide interchange protein
MSQHAQSLFIMKKTFSRVFLLLGFLAAALLLPRQLPAQAPTHPKPDQSDIYDESADGSKQIADALMLARKEGKNVLLQFGANWCVWCHRLHGLYESDKEIAGILKNNYVVVMVDVNKDHNQATDLKYRHPISHGLPVIVILDADGKQLTTKDSGELEEGDHHSPVKVTAFLKEWAPKNK